MDLAATDRLLCTTRSVRKRLDLDRAVEPAMERLEEFARFVAAERVFAGQIVKESGEQPR